MMCITGNMRLMQALLSRYFRRYIERELTHENLRRMWKPYQGWKEVVKTRWEYGEHRPWTQAFKDANPDGTLPRPIYVEPIKEWNIFKGDRVSVLSHLCEFHNLLSTQPVNDCYCYSLRIFCYLYFGESGKNSCSV